MEQLYKAPKMYDQGPGVASLPVWFHKDQNVKNGDKLIKLVDEGQTTAKEFIAGLEQQGFCRRDVTGVYFHYWQNKAGGDNTVKHWSEVLENGTSIL